MFFFSFDRTINFRTLIDGGTYNRLHLHYLSFDKRLEKMELSTILTLFTNLSYVNNSFDSFSFLCYCMF